jgi:ATP/maltotriose-dependent transcriptional regulator MalT
VSSLRGRRGVGARGLSNHQISWELNLALATVKRHLANVYQRIRVGSRSEAVRMALQEQWIVDVV